MLKHVLPEVLKKSTSISRSLVHAVVPGFVGGRGVAAEKADSGRPQHAIPGGSGRSHGGHSSIRAESICNNKCHQFNNAFLERITNDCVFNEYNMASLEFLIDFNSESDSED